MSSGRVPRAGAPEQVLEPGLELARGGTASGRSRRRGRRAARGRPSCGAATRAAAAARAGGRACAARGRGRTRPRGRSSAHDDRAGPAVVGLDAVDVGLVGRRPSTGSRPGRGPGPAPAAAGRGRASSGSIGVRPTRLRQVAVELELGDLRLVVAPLGALVAQEPLEDVLAQRLGDELGPLHHVERLGERLRAACAMPSAARSSAVSSKTLADASGGSS